MEYGRNYMPEKWCVSEFCLCDEVRNSMKLPKKVHLRDSTIREGDETPGCYMPPDVKLKIAKKIWEIGFKEIDVGFVGTVKEHFEAASLNQRKYTGINNFSYRKNMDTGLEKTDR